MYFGKRRNALTLKHDEEGWLGLAPTSSNLRPSCRKDDVQQGELARIANYLRCSIPVIIYLYKCRNMTKKTAEANFSAVIEGVYNSFEEKRW